MNRNMALRGLACITAVIALLPLDVHAQASRRKSKKPVIQEEKVVLSPGQLAAMKTGEIDANTDTVWRATISVLYAQGWQFRMVDKDSGIIQATSLRNRDVIGPTDDYRTAEPDIEKMRTLLSEFKGHEIMSPPYWIRWEEVTVLMEPSGRDGTRLQAGIIKFGSLPAGLHYYPLPKSFGYTNKKIMDNAKEQSIVLNDPKEYQVLFQRVQMAAAKRK